MSNQEAKPDLPVVAVVEVYKDADGRLVAGLVSHARALPLGSHRLTDRAAATAALSAEREEMAAVRQVLQLQCDINKQQADEIGRLQQQLAEERDETKRMKEAWDSSYRQAWENGAALKALIRKQGRELGELDVQLQAERERVQGLKLALIEVLESLKYCEAWTPQAARHNTALDKARKLLDAMKKEPGK